MRVVRAILFLAATAAACAEEKAARPAEKSAPPSEDSIAAAKRDFDAVKAARGTPAQAGAELPSLATPEFRPDGSAPLFPTSRTDAAAAAKKKKSANWLVEAMAESEKKSAGKNGREKTRDEHELTSETETATETPADKRQIEPKKNTDPVINPLDRYMAGWMTPQDLALLRPVMNAERASGDAMLAPLAAGTTDYSRPESLGLLQGGSSPTGAQNHSAPRENPFLQSLAPPVAPVNLPPPPSIGGAPASATASNVFMPPPSPATNQRSVTPSFVKPRDDEKYYKQMKRF